MMTIQSKRDAQDQVVDYDFWAVFLSVVAVFFFLLNLLLAKVPSHANWLDVFASRGLRVCSVSAFVTAIVALFRFRYSRGLAIRAHLRFVAPLAAHRPCVGGGRRWEGDSAPPSPSFIHPRHKAGGISNPCNKSQMRPVMGQKLF